jgi:hypothetical protein
MASRKSDHRSLGSKKKAPGFYTSDGKPFSSAAGISELFAEMAQAGYPIMPHNLDGTPAPERQASQQESMQSHAEQAARDKKAKEHAERMAKAAAQEEARRKADAEMEKRAEAHRLEQAKKAKRDAEDAAFEKRAAEVRAEQVAREQEQAQAAVEKEVSTPSAPEAHTKVTIETSSTKPATAMTFEERAEAYRREQIEKIERDIAEMRTREEAIANRMTADERRIAEGDALDRLRECIWSNDAAELKSLLLKDRLALEAINRNEPAGHDHPKGPALHYAITRLSSVDVIRTLIKHGADVNQVAVSLPLVLDDAKCTRDPLNPLYRVVWECMAQRTLLPGYLAALVEAGADLSALGPSLRESFVNAAPFEALKDMFCPKGFDYRPSLFAFPIYSLFAKKKDGIVCQLMKVIYDWCQFKGIHVGVDPPVDVNDVVPLLHSVVQRKFRRTLRFLVKIGADVNKLMPMETEHFGVQHVSALDLAIGLYDDAEMAYILARAGGDVGHSAATTGDTELRTPMQRATPAQRICLEQGNAIHHK